jgi:hypothetical protein
VGNFGKNGSQGAASWEHFQAQPHPAGYCLAGLLKVFSEVTGKVGRLFECWEHIDKSEKVEFDSFIGHAPAHYLIIKPSRAEEDWAGTIDSSQQVAANAAGEHFQMICNRGCHVKILG